MPGWSTDSNGQIRLTWNSLDDFLNWVNQQIAPAAAQYGYRLILEPLKKDEVNVDRA